MYVIDLVEEDPIKMEWTIVILFAAAILLLILSFVKTKQSSKTVDQQIEELSYSFTNEIKQLQQQIRNMELDAEITAQEAGILPAHLSKDFYYVKCLICISVNIL